MARLTVKRLPPANGFAVYDSTLRSTALRSASAFCSLSGWVTVRLTRSPSFRHMMVWRSSLWLSTLKMVAGLMRPPFTIMANEQKPWSPRAPTMAMVCPAFTLWPTFTRFCAL